MVRLKIKNLPKDHKISKAEMKKVIGGVESYVFLFLEGVLLESYLDSQDDLAAYAFKVDFFNQQKESTRDYINSIRNWLNQD